MVPSQLNKLYKYKKWKEHEHNKALGQALILVFFKISWKRKTLSNTHQNKAIQIANACITIESCVKLKSLGPIDCKILKTVKMVDFVLYMYTIQQCSSFSLNTQTSTLRNKKK